MAGCGGPGKDTVKGGGGEDTLLGQKGKDAQGRWWRGPLQGGQGQGHRLQVRGREIDLS
jgi:RTX calcium-binding nonapeptide repeat (4 copies)